MLAFLISRMKMLKRIEKCELGMVIRLEEHFCQQFLPAGRDGTEIMPSYLVISPRLEKSPYTGGTKISRAV